MDNFIKVITTQGMWGAVISTIVFVAIGFAATRAKIVTKEMNGRLSKMVLNFFLPFMVFTAFMQGASKEDAAAVGIVLGSSLVFYILFTLLSYLLVKLAPKFVSSRINRKAEEVYAWNNANATVDSKNNLSDIKAELIDDYKIKLMTSQFMLIYGSLQFFALPLVHSLSDGVIFPVFTKALLQVWCVPYLIGAFGHVPMFFSEQKNTKKTVGKAFKILALNPIIIALFISLLLWALQFIPGLDTKFVGVYKVSTDGTGMTFWGAFPTALPALYKTMQIGTGLVSPISWLVIGGSLATGSIRKAIKDKDVLITSARRMITVPLVVLLVSYGVFAGFVYGKALTPEVAAGIGTLIVLLAATPPAGVISIYSAANDNKYTVYIAQVSSLTTLLALIFLPLWLIISYSTFGPVLSSIVA